MARKGKMSSIRWKASKRRDKSIRPETIDKMVREMEERDRPPKIRRKKS
jgi:hypothetical protein